MSSRIGDHPPRCVQANPDAANQSRRSFLARIAFGSLGLVTAAGLFPPLSRLVHRDRPEASDASQEFPGPDSIFHPASDPRLDPRRK